jgi:hypothetical protein
MSGLQTNLKYDQNTTFQNLVQITRQHLNYDFFQPKYENYPQSQIVSTCDGKFLVADCVVCDANQGSMTNTLQNLTYRLDVENDLLGKTRLLSGCDTDKYLPYYAKDANAPNPNKAIVQPLLCERKIVPTNMKPFTSPFPDPSAYSNFGFPNRVQ